MIDCEIRDAQHEDLPELLEIFNEQILNSVYSFRINPLTPIEGERWYVSHSDPRYPILVAQPRQPATVNRTALGWASLSPWSDYEAYHRTAEVSVWIRPEHQRQGLGHQLMASLIARARHWDFRVLLSRVEASNRGSLSLHQRLGFQTIGTMHRVGEKFGRLLDVVMLELQL